MIAGPSTLSQLLFSISSDKQGKSDTYYDDFLLRIETPQYDDISAGNVLFTHMVALSDLVYYTTCASLLCIGLLWIARYPLRETLHALGHPLDHARTHFACTCSCSPAAVLGGGQQKISERPSISADRAQPLSNQSREHTSQAERQRPSTSALAQATEFLNTDSRKNETLTEENGTPNNELLDSLPGDFDGSPKRSPSPGRASQVTKGLAQANDPHHAPLDGPSTCPSCGGSTSVTQHARRAGGRSELIVQDGSLALMTESGYKSDPHSTPSSPADSAPLSRTLNYGSSEQPAPSDDVHKISALDVFVIAKSDEGEEHPLGGPEIDTNYLREELSPLSNVRFHAISDFDATLDNVQISLTNLWKNANARSHLLFFLTGHGIDNRMELYGDEFIDESYIQNVLHQLDEEDPKQLRTIVIFDICRYDQNQEVASMDHRISLIWSCSLGQRAGSLQFKSRAPGSFFLNALFRAYQDVCENRPGSPEDHLETRVRQLALYNSYRDHMEAEPKCKVCTRDRIWCAKAFVMADRLEQNVDLSQAQGDIKRLFDFLYQAGYEAKLPEGVLAFFSKLELFEERGKYSSQMSYLFRNPRDTQAWRGWLSWVVWSIWEYIWILVIHTLVFNRLTGGSYGERVEVKGEKKRSRGVDQAPSPEVVNPDEAQPPNPSKLEMRGAKVSVATAQAPSLV